MIGRDRASGSSGAAGSFSATTQKAALKIPNLRWYIAGLLLISTTINYIDRQTLSVLASFLKVQYHWNNSDLAWIFIVRATYGIGQCLSGWFLDKATIVLVMPADLFRVDSVATVSGRSGTGDGLMTVLFTHLIGYVSDKISFGPALIAASVMPLAVTRIVFMLVRTSAFEVAA